jgi:hypothetical protein
MENSRAPVSARTFKYTVQAYDNADIPEPRWMTVGEFDSAEKAVQCAQSVIDRSLRATSTPGESARMMHLGYLCYGEVPSVFNGEGLQFDSVAYVHRRMRELTGEADWQPKE